MMMKNFLNVFRNDAMQFAVIFIKHKTLKSEDNDIQSLEFNWFVQLNENNFLQNHFAN